jgi:cellulase/cellobiase CelA1
VANPGDGTATWEVEMAVDGRITNLWGASSAPGSGGRLRFVGVEWNASLGPGGSTTFGFCADR